MKKLISMLISIFMTVSLAYICMASDGDVVLRASDVTYKSETGVTVNSTAMASWGENGFVGFKSVDMTNIKSIGINAACTIPNWTNGEAFRVWLDSPKNGIFLGYIIANSDGTKDYFLNVENSYSGAHDLYIASNYHTKGYVTVNSVTLSKTAYVDANKITPVPDSRLVDNYHDTWVATDDLGRTVADYEEVGPLKEGAHYVGMFYWDSHGGVDDDAVIASQAIAKYPEAKDDFDNKVWGKGIPIFWGEPIWGFYTSSDYWVYRKSAELLANAGVDVIFFDCTNGDRCFVVTSKACFDAFHDARQAGVNAPKISAYMPMGGQSADRWRMTKAWYLNFYKDDRYSDLWFKWEGKPFLIQTEFEKGIKGACDTGDSADKELMKEVLSFFNVRGSGSRSKGPNAENKDWLWLENYPQWAWGKMSDGRVECVGLGIAINQSYVYNYAATGVFSDPYTKGRSYTEGFGEDDRPGAKRQGYFFREQESRVLDVDPAFVFIDGWNEWNTTRSKDYNGFSNAFIDLYDDENSRDIEPSKGALGDDYYNLLVDFVRKYKGVRPAPVASSKVTIDINGNGRQWDNVGPEFINDNGDYERDALGFKNRETGQNYHYTTKVYNAILKSKVARDDNNFYFYVKTAKDIKEGTPDFMQLYINTDRNHATGFSGYDYAVNLTGLGELSKNAGNAWSWEKVSNVTYKITGDVMQLVIPRSLIGEAGTVDLEFKWADGINVNGDMLNFYAEGNTAPMGRFNYLYTEIQQTAVTKEQREALKNVSIFKADSNRMIVNGGKMNLYEPDTGVKSKLIDKALYFPADVLNETLGYGRTKVEWADTQDNMLIVKTFDLVDMKISNEVWIYTTAGSNEVRINGKAKVLKNPVKVINGIPYVPLTLLEDCFGWSIQDMGGGIYATAKTSVNIKAVTDVLSHIK
ncbi:MAG: stalk domain-containing protein [Bacillota bacterium]|nr:stalk domain-containing protein [Bacillota bacterium]